MTAPAEQWVIAGLPGSGAAWVHGLIGATRFADLKWVAGVRRAATAMTPGRHVMTFDARDVFDPDGLAAACAAAGKRLGYMLAVADPRAALLARHPLYRRQWRFDHDHGLHVEKGIVSLTDPGVATHGSAIETVRSRASETTLFLRREDWAADPAREWGRVCALLARSSRHGFTEAPVTIDAFKPEVLGDAEASRLMRQCRLAPAIANLVEVWGYAPDRAWLDTLALRTPSAFDDRPGTILAYHTGDPLYRGEAERMRASTARLSLPTEIVEIADRGTWLANTRIKVDVLVDARRRIDGPLLYADADAIFHADPWPALRGIEADAAFCVMRDGQARSGTVLIADTPGGHRFLADWAARLTLMPEAWDQHPLNDVIAAHGRGETPYSVALLPVSMCHVFDRSGMSDPALPPVIEHLQASREGKRADDGVAGHIARRAERIAEIMATFGF